MIELAPGRTIADYRLDRVLGSGGMGEVWSATHLATGDAVALKVLKAQLRGRAQMRRRLLREARAATAVNHPNVVRVRDVIDADEHTPVIVMDLLEGETLAKRLLRSDALSLEETAALLLPVVAAVAVAHERGIVHRDLKPDNIFIATKGNQCEIKVLDFGIAKLMSPEGEGGESGIHTETGSMLGTPCYMAPEQGFGERDIDQRADVWALGAILYECLSGGRPIEAANLGQYLKQLMRDGIAPLERVSPGLPDDVVRLGASMLKPDRAERLSNLAEVRDVLGRFAPEFASATIPHTSPTPSRVRPVLVAIAAAGTVAILLRATSGYETAHAAKFDPVHDEPASGGSARTLAAPLPESATAIASDFDVKPRTNTPRAERAAESAVAVSGSRPKVPMSPIPAQTKPFHDRRGAAKKIEFGNNEAPIIE